MNEDVDCHIDATAAKIDGTTTIVIAHSKAFGLLGNLSDIKPTASGEIDDKRVIINIDIPKSWPRNFAGEIS